MRWVVYSWTRACRFQCLMLLKSARGDREVSVKSGTLGRCGNPSSRDEETQIYKWKRDAVGNLMRAWTAKRTENNWTRNTTNLRQYSQFAKIIDPICKMCQKKYAKYAKNMQKYVKYAKKMQKYVKIWKTYAQYAKFIDPICKLCKKSAKHMQKNIQKNMQFMWGSINWL